MQYLLTVLSFMGIGAILYPFGVKKKLDEIAQKFNKKVSAKNYFLAFTLLGFIIAILQGIVVRH